jgi:hypothetical protein
MALFMVELVLLILTLLAIAYPLFRKEAAFVLDNTLTESDFSDLLYRKEAAYIALVDLEFDYKTGKIADDDYKTMKSSMESEALGLIKKVDEYEKTGSTQSVAPKTDKKRFCHGCGITVTLDQRFCSECGAKL